MPRPDLRIIISGGGTGGHIFPALAIAEAIGKLRPEAKILFVGALGKMEMEKVPAAGFDITGIPIRGLQRKASVETLLLPLRIKISLFKAWRIINSFKPDVVVGVGGYASGPVLMVAAMIGKPSLIQEQNSFAGITNRVLGKFVSKVAVAYEGMQRFFPRHKLMLTGNPVRNSFGSIEDKKAEAFAFFGLTADQPTLLVTGGSLGALTINESMAGCLPKLVDQGIQVIWQCGKNYYPHTSEIRKKFETRGVRILDFISRMDLAYAIADVVVSRAGAIAISELCLTAKPCILIPSPNVAEDHQTHNAQALVARNAALMVNDSEARKILGTTILGLMKNDAVRTQLKENIGHMAKPHAADEIAAEIIRLSGK